MNSSQDRMVKSATQHRHTLNQNTSQKSYCNDYVRSNIIDILTLLNNVLLPMVIEHFYGGSGSL